MQVTRRDVLKLAGVGAAAAMLPAGHTLGAAWRPASVQRQRRRVLRFAHLSDMHTQPERRAGEGLAACLRHVQSLPDRPELIITGGDHVMDAFAAKEARAKQQWDLWARVLKDECSLPVESCLGNHDIWGWNKKRSGATGDEPNWGKAWTTEALRISGRYRSFDRAGWHMVFLDSVFPNGDSYLAKLDDEQFEWLSGDLAAVDPATPVMIVSHIPILSIAVLSFGKPERTDNVINPMLMHTDAGRLQNLFLKHPNVRLCISGHLHLVDRCEYDGVTYLCNGAVCGNWWKGPHQRCQEGYAVIDLFDDGTFEREYVAYGWKAET